MIGKIAFSLWVVSILSAVIIGNVWGSGIRGVITKGHVVAGFLLLVSAIALCVAILGVVWGF